MSANSTTPLQGSLLLSTQFELVSSTTAAGTLYGIAFSLYCLYLHASLPQLRGLDRRRRTQFMITYSTIIMLCGLYYLVSNAWVVQDAYIKHANFPGGPVLYVSSTFLTQPVIAVGLVCVSVVDISTAAIQIWRLWVVWSSTRHVRIIVIQVPTHCYAILALRIRRVYLDLTILRDVDSVFRELKIETAELALQAISTILPTILIAGFLIFESRHQRELIGKPQLSTPYMTVVAMLIESYAMESTWVVVMVVSYNLALPMNSFFGETQAYIEIIAYLLVLYRVANGRAHESQRARESRSRIGNISSLHWNHTTTQPGVASGTDTNTHPGENKPEPEILLVEGSPA
ncbi:hypothetical protein AGABI1DRAFT_132439 [Agaricus bisporus var. burnettii JB137-S8]|uniref:G-protein coupled receptors family 1 profile domain-containing protein n=1 Tax=Agaricus bisporus var. burnettii (strain JB137-S8 / ATCC MYA-4627 / FGSC 10392) TaxID=597362 RepID=K5WWL2_AGABU|nr:uncharacterized protein AGABI1DRAFT_132439 [Agaricus bisporus var. burnettii JB137-S8]EKM75188.1 hypothetical protein AGABI1DRAFT_132439 [Agaricus bisporus var. burnettii JB137-S8]